MLSNFEYRNNVFPDCFIENEKDINIDRRIPLITG